MIELKNVNGGYGRKQVLFDICETINDGEITSIIGPNGCGKTTLIETASGLNKPFNGTVFADGEDTHKMEPKKRARKISLLSQQRNAGVLTVRALVYHGRFPYLGYPRKYTDEDKIIVEKAMRTAGVYDIANESVASLSGGQQQKAYIAMILAQDTDIVFLDEPITFLDINYQLELMEIIKEMKKNGKTVIMVIHDLNMAMRFSDKVIVMKDGKIVSSGTPERIYGEGVIEKVFGIEARFSKEEKQYFFIKSRGESD